MSLAKAFAGTAGRKSLCAQASSLALRSAIGAVAVAGSSLLVPGVAQADCIVGGITITCGPTVTTDTTFPANIPSDRDYQGVSASPLELVISPGDAVSGHGLAVTNAGTGGVAVTNNGSISVDVGSTPTAGGTAALTLKAAGGPISYTGSGGVANNGAGNAIDAVQTAGVGSVNLTITGDILSAAGEGITVRDVATSTGVTVTTGAVTALTAGKDGIDVQTQSLNGDVTIVANGTIKAGNAGIVAAVLAGAATGDISVTAGDIDGRFGVDAENFGSGATTVDVGNVSATDGNAIFARTAGGDVIVAASSAIADSNVAIIARQTKAAGAGIVAVTATGDVSGTIGIEATNSGLGATSVTAGGKVTGTSAEGIKATGNDAVTIDVAGVITGATTGLLLTGGAGGAGDISVTAGGLVGGTDNAAKIQNNGSGNVSINISGDTSSTGGEGIVVRDTAAAGYITVTTGAVTALTAGKDGIDVQTQGLTGDLTIVANGAIKAGNAGIVAAILQGAATGDIVVVANGAIDGRFGIDAENFGSGVTTVATVGPITVTDGNGVFARTAGGDVNVTTGAVVADSNTAIIARQTKAAGLGAIQIFTTGDVSGTIGIEATNSGLGATSVTAGGKVTGTSGEGIKATGNDAVTIDVAGVITGATTGLLLTGGIGGAGDISVTAGGLIGGTENAAKIQNNGSGSVTVDISGATSSTGGEGIVVRDTAAAGAVSVTTGAVTALTAGKDGIDVQTQGLTGDVTIVANGTIKAGNAGIVGAVLAGAATGDISVTAGDIDGRFGVDAENFGSGATTVDVGNVTATDGNAIFARTAGGDVIVTAGSAIADSNVAIIARQTKAGAAGIIQVKATGAVSGSTGIEATNSGTGAISVTAGGKVTGTSGEGIKATGNDAVTIKVADTVTGSTTGLLLIGGTGGAGNISVTGTGGFVGGTSDAANIKNNGSGSVTVDISGASSSAAGEGIFVRDTAAGGAISVTTGAVTALTAGKDGIDVQTQGLTGDLTIIANGDIKAGNAGIVGAVLQAGAVGDIRITAGDIDARFGVDAENFGSGATIVDVGDVTATNGNAIFARTGGGDVIVTASSATADSNIAIIARQTKAGAAGIIQVKATGAVSGSTGIEATNSGLGATSVTAGGKVTGTSGEGIKATGNDAVTIKVADTVTGSTTGLLLIGGTGGAGNISVTGTGGFVGGTSDAANIKNNGSGSVTVDISGASSSAAGEGIFVRDTAAGGAISVTTGAVTALTAGKDGIDVQTQGLTGDLTIVANGTIKAGNAGIVGAVLQAGAVGDIRVTAGDIDARFGVDAENFGSGDTFVDVGDVTATDGNAVFARTGGGDVVVTTGSATADSNIAIIARQTKAGAAGIIQISATGAVSGSTGIEATNSGTGALSITTAGTVTGTAAEGIRATGNGGAGVEVADTVTGATTGMTLTGGTGGSGNLLVFGTGGFVGQNGDGLSIVNNGSGNTTVDISGATTATNAGIKIDDTAAGGDINVTTGAITTTSLFWAGIDISADTAAGDMNITANGDLNGGIAGALVVLQNAAATGDLSVTANGAVNAIYGIDAENFGSGSTTVTTVGPVTATSGNGVFALSSGGDVTVTTGAVSSTGAVAVIAQQANAGGAGDISVTTNGAITGGIASANSGTGDLTIAANDTVTAAGTAVSAQANGGDIDVTVDDATSTSGSAVFAQNFKAVANTGTIDVTLTAGATITALTAGNFGIFTNSGNSSGTTTINVNGAINAAGAGVKSTSTVGDIVTNVSATGSIDPLIGIDQSTISGAITVNNAGLAEGDNIGVRLVSTGAGAVGALTVNQTGSGLINGIAQQGVLLTGADAAILITGNGAASKISGGTLGVEVSNSGVGTISIADNTISGGSGGILATTTGVNAGISVTGAGGVTTTTGTAIDVSINNAASSGDLVVNRGGVSGGAGISAKTNGSGDITVVATGAVTATAGDAIAARNTNLVANTGTIGVGVMAGQTVSATGGSGIVTDSGLSTGLTFVVVAGEVKATGAGQAGIKSTSTTGGITVQVLAGGKVDPAVGVDLTTITGALTVSNGGLIAGDTTGVALTATGTGTGTITNTGTITGGVNAVLGTFNGGAFTLNNTGTMNGALNIAGSNVATTLITNAAAGIANFSGTSSVSGGFANAGVANIAAGGSVTFLGAVNNANRINFAGAGTFTTNGAMTNGGIINARNNNTGNVITVAGAYTGGGQFFADYSTVTATADQLNITGAVTGNTNVAMNLVGPRTLLAGGFLPVVTVAPGAAANAFTSNTAFPTTGFILDSFGQNPLDNTEFGILQEINPAVTTISSLSYVAEVASALIDDPISPYALSIDPAGADHLLSFWIRAAGGDTRQTIVTTIDGGGLSFVAADSIETTQVALQAGADMGFFGLGGGQWDLHVGVTAGWYDGDARLPNAEQLGADATFLGGYVVATNGPLTLEGSIRREWREFELRLPSVFGPDSPDVDGSATAGSINASYRFGGETGFRATPFLSYDYADSEIDNVQIDPLSTYSPGGDDTSIGQLGVRFSYRIDGASPVLLEPFAAVSALKNWSSEDEATFVFAGTSFVQETESWDDAMRYAIGISAKTRDDKLAGFVAGAYNDSSRLDGYTVNAGFRLKF